MLDESDLSETHERRRRRMVETQLVTRDITHPAVLAAMGTVPRHLFVRPTGRSAAYDDHPLPIGNGQTISQPYIVASMTQEVEASATDRTLEIGTGCGYQTAVLAEIVAEVYSVEVIPELHSDASRRLAELGYHNVHARCADGSLGWPEAAPFDGIVVTAAAPRLPMNLIEQLTVGAHLIVPIGPPDGDNQNLIKATRTPTGVITRSLYGVRFVPMIGAIADR